MVWFKKNEESELDDSKEHVRHGSWRDNLKGVWRESEPGQKNVNGLKYSSLLQVPSTRGARLLKSLIKQEESLARVTGYNVKLVEKAGTPLARLFQRVYVPQYCHGEDCHPCLFSSDKEASKCRMSNIVYEATCLLCIEQLEKGSKEKKDVSKYIGESSRTLAEISREQVSGAGNLEYENFIVKHWISCHNDSSRAPNM